MHSVSAFPSTNHYHQSNNLILSQLHPFVVLDVSLPNHPRCLLRTNWIYFDCAAYCCCCLCLSLMCFFGIVDPFFDVAYSFSVWWQTTKAFEDNHNISKSVCCSEFTVTAQTQLKYVKEILIISHCNNHQTYPSPSLVYVEAVVYYHPVVMRITKVSFYCHHHRVYCNCFCCMWCQLIWYIYVVQQTHALVILLNICILWGVWWWLILKTLLKTSARLYDVRCITTIVPTAYDTGASPGCWTRTECQYVKKLRKTHS